MIIDNGFFVVYNVIGYRGYYLDSETGCYFLNARYYSPEWRRFISPDDTAYLDPKNVNGLNLYCYCGNDPIMYTDASGNDGAIIWLSTLLVVVGGVLGAVLGALADHDIGSNIDLKQPINSFITPPTDIYDTGADDKSLTFEALFKLAVNPPATILPLIL